MIISLLALRKKAYYEVAELSGVPLFFPFYYDVTLELLSDIKEINIGNFGGKLVAYGQRTSINNKLLKP